MCPSLCRRPYVQIRLSLSFFSQLSLPLSDYRPSPVLDGWQLTYFHLPKQLWVIFCSYSPECVSGLCLTCYACSYFSMGCVQCSYCILFYFVTVLWLVHCVVMAISFLVCLHSPVDHCGHLHHNMLNEGFLFCEWILNILLIDWGWVWLMCDKWLWISISLCLKWVQISFIGLKLTRSQCTHSAKEDQTFQFEKS